MRIREVCLVLAAAVALSGCGSSDSRVALLRFKGKPGDQYTLEYDTTTTVQQVVGGQPREATDVSSIKVIRGFTCKSVDGAVSEWEARTVDAVGTGMGTMGGEAMAVAGAEKRRKPYIFKRDERNQVLTEDKTSPIECEFPIQEVRVGDAWRSEARQYGIKLNMLYTLEKFEVIDGREAAVIKGTIEDGRNVRLSKPARAWFDLETGWLIRGECEFIVEQSASLLLTVTMNVLRK